MNNTSNSTADANGPLVIYTPNVPLGIIASALFALAFLVHFFQYWKLKSYFFYLMVIGAGMETAGYVSKAFFNSNTTEALPFIISYFTIILAPSFMAAACYMAIGRLLYWVTPVQCRDFRHLWVPARFIAPIFITFDVISFLIQFLGVAIIAGTINSKDSPSDIKTQTDRGFAALRLGLILQLLCFALFYLISIRFMVVSKRWRNEWPEGDNGKWRKFGFVINITSGLIVLRSIYRVIEYAGSDEVRGYNESHEWPLYIFDALLMILVFAVFAVFHPAKYLPERYTRFRLRRKLLMAQKPHGSVVYNVSAPEYAPAGYMELGYRR